MPKLKIIDRYILSELLPPFFLSMAVLLLVLYLEKLFRIADLVVAKGAILASVVRILAYAMPGFLVITLPMSLVVATITAFSRLSTDSEITAMKASRISLYRMVKPVFLFAVLIFLITALTSLVLVPGANMALKTHLFAMMKSRAMMGIEPGVFSTSFGGMVMYVDKADPHDRDAMEGVFIFDERSPQEPHVIIAKYGRMIPDDASLRVTLAMHDGTIQPPIRSERNYSFIGFDDARLFLDVDSAMHAPAMHVKGLEDMSSNEVLREIRRLRKEGKATVQLETELQKRLSIPFACLVLGLISVPLGIRRARTGKSAGVAIALLVFLLYYIMLGTASSLAESRTLRPLQAYWIPNLLMFAFAVLFVVKRAREINFGIADALFSLHHRLRRGLKRQR